ncbi:helix-turn-helix domain-containing protein [Kribbella sp. NPDC048915]|uniref:helix-turn-helix domain-containing protein n=1 Tax=Kribbella sp. NPDC048915 TaxID=3155148 RepID=UPI00340A66DE
MSESATPTLSDLLRTFRTRAGLTQAALAEKAGLSEQAISVLERGTRTRPRIDTVRSLTAALALTPSEADQFLSVARGKGKVHGATTATVATGVVPALWQLPPAASDFTGRSAQVDAILSALRDPIGIAPTTVGIVAITGMGGIGKTTLAVHAAHKLADSYPDGHLYLNLRGYGPGAPMPVADAQRHLLRSLGTDSHAVPDDVDEATALFRSQLAGKRVLLLLDNAADIAQIQPLLPGSPGSSAIITSRGSMLDLPGARQILLDALSEAESIDLLAGLIGQARVDAEPEASRFLATYSGRLPLAIRLIGGRLAIRPSWPIQHFVDLMQDEERRLDSLGSDETGVRARIASSVRFLEESDQDLDRQAARAVPLLALLDGSDLLIDVAAALLEVSLRQASAIVERLVDLNLLESVSPSTYRFHDLIRAYGREVADESLSAAERDDALARVIRFYIEIGWTAHRFTHPTSPRLELATVRGGASLPALLEREQALRWVDAELRNLLDRFRQAKHSRLTDSALLPEMGLAFFGYLESRRRWQEMREMYAGAIQVAQLHRKPEAAAWIQHDCAIPDAESGAMGLAIDQILAALEMFRDIGALAGQARCCSSLAYLLGHEGKIEEALEYGETALALSRTIQDETLEGVSLTAVGGLYDRTGDFVRADEAFAKAIRLAERANDTRAVFKRLLNAAFAHLQVGRHRDAIPMALRSLAIVQEANDTTFQGEGRHLLAIAYASNGDLDEATRHIEAGIEVARASHDAIREGRLYIELAKVNVVRGDSTAAEQQLGIALHLVRNAPDIYRLEATELLDRLRRGETPAYDFTPYSI